MATGELEGRHSFSVYRGRKRMIVSKGFRERERERERGSLASKSKTRERVFSLSSQAHDRLLGFARETPFSGLVERLRFSLISSCFSERATQLGILTTSWFSALD